jgi:catechol 2,3-dioxygenase-like lactoylglutathione lyase family enzyme
MKLSRLLMALVLGAPTLARSNAPADEAPVLTVGGAFFAVSVGDMKASAAWYHEKLGLQVVMRTPKAEGVAATVLEGGGLIVELIQHDDAAPLSRGEPRVRDRTLVVHGLVKAGVIVADFDASVEALRRRGVQIRYGPYPPRDGQRANVIIEDDGGNLIQIFGP